MKTFADNCHLSSQQKNFNYRLSRARVTVEHAYGWLKGRWRCLLKRLDINISDVPKLLAACCALHNICEIHGDTFDEEWLRLSVNQILLKLDLSLQVGRAFDEHLWPTLSMVYRHTIIIA